MSPRIAFVDGVDHHQTTQTYNLIFDLRCTLPHVDILLKKSFSSPNMRLPNIMTNSQQCSTK